MNKRGDSRLIKASISRLQPDAQDTEIQPSEERYKGDTGMAGVQRGSENGQQWGSDRAAQQ